VEAFVLECRRDTVGGLLAEGHRRIERRRTLAQAEEAALPRLQRASGKAAPAQHARDLLHRGRRQISAITTRLQRARRPSKERKALTRIAHPGGETLAIPGESAVRALHRVVRSVIEAPLHIEARYLMP